LNYALSYGFTHAVFKEYIDEETLDDGSTIVVDYKDKHVPFIPQHTFAASADYRFDLAIQHFRSIVLGVNVTGQGPTYWDEANFAKENVFALLGAHADMNFEFSSCRFLLSLWGRNLTNTKYNVFGFPMNGPTSAHFAQQGNGIQVGVDVKLHF
jgi:outer membrane receptor protein involved in Fe transport